MLEKVFKLEFCWMESARCWIIRVDVGSSSEIAAVVVCTLQICNMRLQSFINEYMLHPKFAHPFCPSKWYHILTAPATNCMSNCDIIVVGIHVGSLFLY
ncbi:hypothetical protein EPI10_024748 [Gossypium australe]|uniref:Uncharacterized protein n=1 Tax=Gossypium australe TaxID=47621 RepID=A0A5B6VXV5_9ROSI|nr:hypothetical protein EPI10_024748 [Gossypium australe]